MVSYSVPCPGKVIQLSSYDIPAGETILRTSYGAEGAFRVLWKGTLSYIDLEDMREPPRIAFDPNCPDLREQWVRLAAQDGSEGWVKADHQKLDGLNYYDLQPESGLPVSNPPDWLIARLPADSEFVPSRPGDLCERSGRKMTGEEIAQALLGARGTLRDFSGAERRFWSWETGDARAAGFSQSTMENAQDFPFEIRGAQLCVGENAVCMEVKPCLKVGGDDTRYSYVGTRPGSDEEWLLLSGVTLNARLKTARARDTAPRGGRDIVHTPAMLGLSPEAFMACEEATDRVTCLESNGADAAAATDYARYMRDFDDAPQGAVRALIELGPADIVQTQHPINARNMVLEYATNFIAAHRVSDHATLADTSDPVARRIRQRWDLPPTVLHNAARIIYAYRTTDGILRLFSQVPVVNYCMACRPIALELQREEIAPWRITRSPPRWEDFGRELSWDEFGVIAPDGDRTFSEAESWALLRPDLAQVQRMLARYGYAPGSADGVMGFNTLSALYDFKHEHCLNLATRQGLDPATAQALMNARDLWGQCVGDASLQGPFYHDKAPAARIAAIGDGVSDGLAADTGGAEATGPLPAGWNDAKRAIALSVLEAYGALDGNKDARERIDLVADYADWAVLAMAAYHDEAALKLAGRLGWMPVAPPNSGAASKVQSAGFEWGEDEGDEDEAGDIGQIISRSKVAGHTVATLFSHADGRHILAFRGTANKRDWITNLAGSVMIDKLTNEQVLGAVGMATVLKEIYPDLSYTGHSLGGRLAQAARRAADGTTAVFDSAPLGTRDRLEELAYAVVDLLEQRPASAPLLFFRGPEDVLSKVNGAKDITVANMIERDGRDPQTTRILKALQPFTFFLAAPAYGLVDGIKRHLVYPYGHSMAGLSAAMQEVRIAREEGWIAAILDPPVAPEPDEPPPQFGQIAVVSAVPVERKPTVGTPASVGAYPEFNGVFIRTFDDRYYKLPRIEMKHATLCIMPRNPPETSQGFFEAVSAKQPIDRISWVRQGETRSAPIIARDEIKSIIIRSRSERMTFIELMTTYAWYTRRISVPLCISPTRETIIVSPVENVLDTGNTIVGTQCGWEAYSANIRDIDETLVEHLPAHWNMFQGETMAGRRTDLGDNRCSTASPDGEIVRVGTVISTNEARYFFGAH